MKLIIPFNLKNKQESTLLLIIGLLTVVSTIFLFGKSINYFFFQDDWFVLKRIAASSPQELLNLFSFHTDVIYWRPVGMFMYFLINKLLFGLNPLPYHLVTFVLHFANISLLGYLLIKIFKNKIYAFVATFLFAAAAFQFPSLSWLALSWNIIGLFFFLIAFLFYFKLRVNFTLASFTLTILFFILALASSEFTAIFPIFIIAFELLHKEKSRLNIKIITMPLVTGAIVLGYLFLRIFMFPIPATGEYALKINAEIIQNFFWYILWLLNIPEELKYQTVLTSLEITGNFKEAAKGNLIPLITLSLSTTALFVTLIVNLALKNIKAVALAFIVFTLGLLPVLALPNHSFSYYLMMPSVCLLILIGFAFKTKTNKLLIMLFVTSWFLLSILSVTITRKIHWISGEQRISKEVTEKIQMEYPTFPDNSIIVIYPANIQVKQALMGDNALQVIYNNKTLHVTYLREEPEIQQSGIYYVNIRQ